MPTDPIAAGLTALEVAERVANGQVNRAPISGWTAYRDIGVRNVATLFNALIVPAAVALFVLGDYRSAWAVSALAVVNTLLGLWQEARTKRQLDQLAILNAPTARVRRDGHEVVVPAADVVQDDILLLARGDIVVADGTLLAANGLEVDEALLTGESDPVPRRSGEPLLSGSFCVSGDGAYRVEKVGAASFVNQTSAQARRYAYSPSPMQATLNTLIRVLTATAVLLCLFYVVLYLLRPFPTDELWQRIAATVTSMVPQGLVLMATAAFTLAAVRMSRRGALVQRLSAVETMAAVDTLCLDKTGTLTTCNLTLAQVRILDGTEEEAKAALRLFVWASSDAGLKGIQALRAALGELPAGAALDCLESIAFKSENRFSAVRVRVGDQERTLVLGAVEALRPRLTDDGTVRTEAVWRELLPTGLRLLLLAEASGGCQTLGWLLDQGVNTPRSPRVLRPLALVALTDEVRPEAGRVLEELAGQGVSIKLLSGDNAETVRATVGRLKLALAQEPVVTGDELQSPDAIRKHSVFGRVTPQQKLDVIAMLQNDGRRVAMLGDGVNDVLALKRADLGIAMGAGSSAAKAVAGLVLRDNDFALLPATLDEGRTIVRNVRRAAKLFLLKNVFTFILIVAALGVFGLPFPYLPQQVTLLNALTIGGPAILILVSRSAVRAVRRGFLGEVGWFALSSGTITACGGLCVWLWSTWGGDDLQLQRTLLLSTLVLTGLGNVLLVAERDWRLWAWAALALPVYLGIMYVPVLAYFFALTPLLISQWLAAGGAATAAVTLCFLCGRRTIQSEPDA